MSQGLSGAWAIGLKRSVSLFKVVFSPGMALCWNVERRVPSVRRYFDSTFIKDGQHKLKSYALFPSVRVSLYMFAFASRPNITDAFSGKYHCCDGLT